MLAMSKKDASVPQGQPHAAMIVSCGSVWQHSGRLCFPASGSLACCCFCRLQQQLRVALLSGEQPQMSQSPEHGAPKIGLAASGCRAREASGPNEIIR